MDKDDLPIAKPARGRPRSADKRQVVQQLLDVTEVMLRETSHFDLTERKIAAAAQTNEAMIHYYFGGKDGLVFALILRYYEEISGKLAALESIDTASKNVIRDVFRILINAYYDKPWMARIVVSEFARGRSAIKDFYMEKFGPQGLGLARLKGVLQRLVECGVCNPRTNVDFVALGMYSMITAPFLLTPFSGDANFELSEIKKDDWIDYVADLFGRQLRASD